MAWPLKTGMSQPQNAKVSVMTRKAHGVWGVVALENEIQEANKNISDFNFSCLLTSEELLSLIFTCT